MTSSPDSLEERAPALLTTCGGIDFRNPVLTASGTFGYGQEFDALLSLRGWGDWSPKGSRPAPLRQSTSAHLRNRRRHAELDRPGERRRRGLRSGKAAIPAHLRTRVWSTSSAPRSTSTSTARRLAASTGWMA